VVLSRRSLPCFYDLPRLSLVDARQPSAADAETSPGPPPFGHAARDLATETAPADPARAARTSRARAASRWKRPAAKAALPWRSLSQRSTLARKESVRRLAGACTEAAQPFGCLRGVRSETEAASKGRINVPGDRRRQRRRSKPPSPKRSRRLAIAHQTHRGGNDMTRKPSARSCACGFAFTGGRCRSADYKIVEPMKRALISLSAPLAKYVPRGHDQPGGSAHVGSACRHQAFSLRPGCEIAIVQADVSRLHRQGGRRQQGGKRPSYVPFRLILPLYERDPLHRQGRLALELHPRHQRTQRSTSVLGSGQP